MALIRKVAQHQETKKWAYIEYSDEEKSVFSILGNKEFDTEAEAVAHSKEYSKEDSIRRGSYYMDFGNALILLKRGHRVARKGWNGKRMFLIIINSGEYSIPHVVIEPGNIVEYSPWIGMKTADGKFVPWLASQTDLLAEDWEEVKFEDTVQPSIASLPGCTFVYCPNTPKCSGTCVNQMGSAITDIGS